MIVVAIVSILATVALPAYSNYVIRGKIPDATGNLAAKRVAMEQFFQDKLTYAGGPCSTADTASSQYFTFACTGAAPYTLSVAPTTAVYTIQAVGIGSMAGFSYTIDQNNTKTSAIVSPANSGWIASSNSCWITKQGGVC